MSFSSAENLPPEVQAEIDRINAIPAAQRQQWETDFLNARSSYTSDVLIESDTAGNILRCSGTATPTTGTVGFSKGCLFTKTNANAGTSGLYVNVGTTSSCDFRLVTNA